VICCVRSPAWILDSVEQLVARNPFRISKMFDPNRGVNIYQRVEGMMMKEGFVGMPLANLRQAWYSDQAGRLIAVRYDSLASEPGVVMNGLYKELGIAPFSHDFERVEYDEAELDARVNMPGLHTVAGRVAPRKRATVLPPELFKQADHSFWDAPGQNPRGVVVL
jgi:sulfotransferase